MIESFTDLYKLIKRQPRSPRENEKTRESEFKSWFERTIKTMMSELERDEMAFLAYVISRARVYLENYEKARG